MTARQQVQGMHPSLIKEHLAHLECYNIVEPSKTTWALSKKQALSNRQARLAGQDNETKNRHSYESRAVAFTSLRSYLQMLMQEGYLLAERKTITEGFIAEVNDREDELLFVKRSLPSSTEAKIFSTDVQDLLLPLWLVELVLIRYARENPNAARREWTRDACYCLCYSITFFFIIGVFALSAVLAVYLAVYFFFLVVMSEEEIRKSPFVGLVNDFLTLLFVKWGGGSGAEVRKAEGGGSHQCLAINK